jgi:hypothetical protein
VWERGVREEKRRKKDIERERVVREKKSKEREREREEERGE